MVRIEILDRHGHTELQVAEQNVASVEVKAHTYNVTLEEANRRLAEVLGKGGAAVQFMTADPAEAGEMVRTVNPLADHITVLMPMVGG